MSYSSRMYSLSAALLMSSALITDPGPVLTSGYEARLTGAYSVELRGATAEFGTVPVPGGPFVLTLGAMSEHGAVVLTRWDGRRPAAGTYPIAPGPSSEGIQALVVTGGPARPTGVFRARDGTVTITASGGTRVAGRFEMEAEGFLASAPEREDRRLSVKGSFSASPSR